MVRRRAVLVLLTCALLPVGCTSDDGGAEPEPSPSRSGGTVAMADPGARLVVTAGVAAVLTPDSFVVRDADLGDGLLVIGAAPRTLRRPDLVTIDGVVRLFDYEQFADRYSLGDPAWYDDYEGRNVLVADRVTSLA